MFYSINRNWSNSVSTPCVVPLCCVSVGDHLNSQVPPAGHTYTSCLVIYRFSQIVANNAAKATKLTVKRVRIIPNPFWPTSMPKEGDQGKSDSYKINVVIPRS